MRESYIARNADVAARRLGDEVVIFRPDDGELFNLNPQAALVLNDGGYHSFYQVVQACPKPSYQALKSLIRDEWWTGRSAFVTDENGRSSFRGFLGQYQLTCRDGAAGFSVSEKGQCQVKMTMP